MLTVIFLAVAGTLPLVANTYVFIVRLWTEPREIAGAEPEWRIVVEHVPSGQRRYTTHINEVATLISDFLGSSAPPRTLHGRVRRWLKRRR